MPYPALTVLNMPYPPLTVLVPVAHTVLVPVAHTVLVGRCTYYGMLMSVYLLRYVDVGVPAYGI